MRSTSILTRSARPLFAFLALSGPGWSQPLPDGRFAAEIAAFAQVNSEAPSHCPVLFVGSSSIRLWGSLEDDMAPISTRNRGFGGATIREINANFEQVVARSRPWAIFFYAGENDLNEGAAPAQVVAEFRAFLDLKVAALGATPVYFISLKPSPSRIAERAAQREVNEALRQLARARADLFYVDVASAMMEQGRPRDIFAEDGLHMSPNGYAIWARRLRPLVLREAARRHAPCTTETESSSGAPPQR